MASRGEPVSQWIGVAVDVKSSFCWDVTIVGFSLETAPI